MKNVRVKINSSGARALLNSSGVAADLRARGQRVLSAAQSLAPVESGAYRDGLSVQVGPAGGRVAARVGSSADHAPIVEANLGVLVRALNGGA